MRLFKKHVNGVFWISVFMLVAIVLGGIFTANETWDGAPWLFAVMIAVTHQMSGYAKGWLKAHGVPSDFADPFDFDFPAEEIEPNGATAEMNYRAHA